MMISTRVSSVLTLIKRSTSCGSIPKLAAISQRKDFIVYKYPIYTQYSPGYTHGLLAE